MSEVRWFKVSRSEPAVVRVDADGRESAFYKDDDAAINFSRWNDLSQEKVDDGTWIPCTEAEAMAHIGRKPASVWWALAIQYRKGRDVVWVIEQTGTETAIRHAIRDGVVLHEDQDWGGQAGMWGQISEQEAHQIMAGWEKQVEPVPEPSHDLRPFWIVWSIDLQKSDDYLVRADAEVEAGRRAEESPGETHYVMEAVRAFRAERPMAVGRQIGGGV